MLTAGELDAYLGEDLGDDDDSNGIVPVVEAFGRIICKEDGVLAGLEEACAIFRHLGLAAGSDFVDGQPVKKGDIVLEARGSARDLMRGERLALNFIGRMSGIATLTAKCVALAPGVRIAATRKTTPGFRKFEKRAIKLGGGDTHRYDLSSAVMIKDNQIRIMGLEDAIKVAKRAASFTKKIEVEVESLEDAEKAAKLGADIIMFDNMKPPTIKKGVKLVKSIDNHILIEASGGISLSNISGYAKTGVDVISLGALTRDAHWLDFSMDIQL
ncbi:MAG TPA: carboxylating nicotinate-nucleotide diphosphorylase [Methanocella sp.]|uniref:carboxylating nicotinate-nucleotide diphosphorylase n=1 Tax=Methanocella sp. TaxID=2052833 RepID=UPI002B6508C0|nr:carboxylating nicotinate-nucleotide diphosphorylase [Methanocella sp.]HTY92215.1 carboxylating nicotinate-nucleotide diphosphorylase [Methanocella sp.]